MSKRFTEISAALSLIFTFIILSFFALSLGVRYYEKSRTGIDSNFSLSVCVNYITSKIRGHGTKGGVAVIDTPQIRALRLCDPLYGALETYIYFFGGYVKELTVEKGGIVTPEYGQNIAALQSFGINEHEGNIISIAVTDNHGNSRRALVFCGAGI